MKIETTEEKTKAIEEHFAKIMEILGLDLSDPSLEKTPERVAKMYVEELCAGLDPDTFPSMSYFPLPDGKKEMVIVKEITIHSLCEHHFLPLSGRACVAYLPTCKLIGLSKIPRLVDYFCRRPQLQERLTAQIADSLSLLLETEDVAVWIEAEHFCVTMRGIKNSSSLSITQDLRGKFRSDPSLTSQFLLNIAPSAQKETT